MTDGFKDKENVQITSHFQSDTFSNKVFSQFIKLKTQDRNIGECLDLKANYLCLCQY